MEVPSSHRECQRVSWIVIGGGVQGTAVSIALRRSGVPSGLIRVIDPHPAPLSVFARLCRQTGMEFMRSPAEHHLDEDPDSLRNFAETDPSHQPRWSIEGNPSCELWLRHSAWVVQRSGVESLRVPAEVQRICSVSGGFRVETSAGSFGADNVVLAPGIGYAPNWPWWALELMKLKSPPRIFHVFEQSAAQQLRQSAKCPLSVGGGITAAQIAIHYAKRWREGDEPVTMLSYHPIRVSAFDCDTAWMGGERLAEFTSERCFDRRRAIVDNSKVRGTVTPEVNSQLQQAVDAGALRIKIARIMGAVALDDGTVELKLSDESMLRSDAVALATGFAHQHRKIPLLDALRSDLDLPFNAHGDPIVSDDLIWGRPGIYVAGALAELELGPFASNIIGARWACERITRALH